MNLISIQSVLSLLIFPSGTQEPTSATGSLHFHLNHFHLYGYRYYLPIYRPIDSDLNLFCHIRYFKKAVLSLVPVTGLLDEYWYPEMFGQKHQSCIINEWMIRNDANPPVKKIGRRRCRQRRIMWRQGCAMPTANWDHFLQACQWLERPIPN